MEPRVILRVEGLAAAAVALAVFVGADGPWWWIVVVGLAPDLSMVAYLAGPRVGALGYNLVHTYVGPLAAGGLAMWLSVDPVLWLSAIWAAHIGLDRTVGYGLKHSESFEQTHLSRQPTPPGLDPE